MSKENIAVGDREMVVGRPWGRAFARSGGSLMVFDYHATKEECLAAIEKRPNPAVAIFPVYVPHLEEGASTCKDYAMYHDHDSPNEIKQSWD